MTASACQLDEWGRVAPRRAHASENDNAAMITGGIRLREISGRNYGAPWDGLAEAQWGTEGLTGSAPASPPAVAAASSRRWCARTPGLRVVGDAREQPPQLNHSRQLAALLERGPEHRWSMGIRTQDRQLPSRPATDSPPQTFPPPPRGRITMADDLKDRGAQDRSQVNVQEDYEVGTWTRSGAFPGAVDRRRAKGGRLGQRGRARVGERVTRLLPVLNECRGGSCFP